MQTRDLNKAADLLVEGSELLARSGQEELAAEVRNLVVRLELTIPKSPSQPDNERAPFQWGPFTRTTRIRAKSRPGRQLTYTLRNPRAPEDHSASRK